MNLGVRLRPANRIRGLQMRQVALRRLPPPTCKALAHIGRGEPTQVGLVPFIAAISIAGHRVHGSFKPALRRAGSQRER